MVALMIIPDAKDQQLFTPVVSFDGEGEPELLVQADRSFTPVAALALEPFKVQALECAQVTLVTGRRDHGHLIEKCIDDLWGGYLAAPLSLA